MEEGVDANRSPYGEVAEVRPGAAATIGTSVGHVFAVSDAYGRFISKVTVRGHGDGVALDAAHLATEATACSAADAPHDPTGPAHPTSRK